MSESTPRTSIKKKLRSSNKIDRAPPEIYQMITAPRVITTTEGTIFDKIEKYRVIINTGKELTTDDWKPTENAIKHLVEEGAKVDFKNTDKENVLFEICRITGHIDDKYNDKDKCKEESLKLFQLFEKNNVVPISNQLGQTVLHLACYYGNEKLVDHILSKYGNLLTLKTENDKQTALHYAAKTDNIDIIVKLIDTYEQVPTKDTGEDFKEAKDYQGRTPLYLAAEYGQKNAVRVLLDRRCSEKVINKHGQKALYWIIAKCPELAPKLLDKYQKCDKYIRKIKYELKNVELEPFSENDTIENGEKSEGEYERKIPKAKSILAFLVDTENLELLTHPVIYNLVKNKWKYFAREWSYFDLFLTFIHISAWTLFANIVPYDEKHIYEFPQDLWRVVLFAIGIVGMLSLLYIEIKEAYNLSKFYEKVIQQRNDELELDEKWCHQKDEIQKNFIRNEKDHLEKRKVWEIYFEDYWNWYDIFSIILLMASSFTHIADWISHTEQLARIHIGIMSVTVIFISFRMLKLGRLINERIGILVMTLYFVLKDIFVWILAYLVFWIPFTSAFFMLFADSQTCVDEACNTQEPIEFMDRYDTIAYGLYLSTMGATELDINSLNEVFPYLSNVLIGLYIGLTTLLMVNILIALLSASFERVHASSKAYFVLQRAKEIINRENSTNAKNRLEHLEELKDPVIENTYTVTDENLKTKDTIELIKESTEDIRRDINNLHGEINKFKILKSQNIPVPKTDNTERLNEKITNLERGQNELKKLIRQLLENQGQVPNISARTGEWIPSEPKVDIRNFNEFEA